MGEGFGWGEGGTWASRPRPPLAYLLGGGCGGSGRGLLRPLPLAAGGGGAIQEVPEVRGRSKGW